MVIQQIRNATLKIRCNGAMFLIDPWLQNKGIGFSVKTIRPGMQGIPCPMKDLPDSPENSLDDVNIGFAAHLHFGHFASDNLPMHFEMIA